MTRGGSRTAATYIMERLAVNYYRKALHLGCCSSPRSASDDHVKNCKVGYLQYIIFIMAIYPFYKV